MRVTVVVLMLAAASVLAVAPCATAQAVSAADREALVRLRVERGGRPEEVEALLRRADEAAAKGLPVQPVVNKIREGLAKGYDGRRIEPVIQVLVSNLEAADRLTRELEPALAASTRAHSVTLLADALGTGVAADEVRVLARTAEGGRPAEGGAALSERVAGAAKGLALIKDAGLPGAEGSAVMGEAMKQGFRPVDMLDLGRSVKRREADFRSGRATLQALRDAIARGERPEQLLRDVRPETPSRPAASRPEPGVERPERPPRPETPQRPEPVERPTRPERPGL
jgi:hypothetical protein